MIQKMKKDQLIHKRKRLGEAEYLLEQRKKILLGVMDTLILQWIRKTPLSGQDLMNKIRKEFDISVGPGTMYPILFNLRDGNLITSTTIEKKKLYHLTPKGKAANKSLSADYLKVQNELELIFKK